MWIIFLAGERLRMPRAVMQPAEVVQPVGVSRVIDITEEEGKRIWAFLKHLDDWKALQEFWQHKREAISRLLQGIRGR